MRKLLLVLMVLTVSSCLPREKLPDFHPVTGVVRLDGKPMAGVVVSFFPDEGPPSGAITDPDGRYVIRHKSGKPGAVAGTHQVEITHKFGGPVKGVDDERPIPPNGNKFTITVQPGENQHDFDMTSS